MSDSNRNDNVHLVGSIAMESCREVFTRVGAALGNQLIRIPDGETGARPYGCARYRDTGARHHSGSHRRAQGRNTCR